MDGEHQEKKRKRSVAETNPPTDRFAKHRKKKKRKREKREMSTPDSMSADELLTYVTTFCAGKGSWHVHQPEGGYRTISGAVEGYFGNKLAGHLKAAENPNCVMRVLVLCSSGIRCCDVFRELRTLAGPKALVAKLFAKHMKLKEQREMLAEKSVFAGVGTPNRVRALLEAGALDLSQCELVLVDCWRNVKGFNIFELKQEAADLRNVLCALADKDFAGRLAVAAAAPPTG
mmetsp:Transcript_18194/g.51332  ORF Transcript_18194/g.51332 Transcript_18194/m.51332 type:complete len:231 (+) Transcript_18194:180-872(+)